MLTKDAILGSEDIKRVKVSVPEWGGHVWVRGLNGLERDDYEQRALDRKDGDKMAMRAWRARMAASTVVDDKGKSLFKPTDCDALAQKNASALDRIVDAALELSGLGVSAADDAEKNSDSGQNGKATSV